MCEIWPKGTAAKTTKTLPCLAANSNSDNYANIYISEDDFKNRRHESSSSYAEPAEYRGRLSFGVKNYSSITRSEMAANIMQVSVWH